MRTCRAISLAFVGALLLFSSSAAAQSMDKKILFGDLHVHTTNSLDAYVFSAPILGGTGASPPSNACDFAKYCSQVDFFALTDHAENLTPAVWADEMDAIKTCNALNNGAGENPELVAFAGFEWTQSSATATQDWGHKNVIFRDAFDSSGAPVRPIGSEDNLFGFDRSLIDTAINMITGLDNVNAAIYREMAKNISKWLDFDNCKTQPPVEEFPDECRESAREPADLFRRVHELNRDALVIPHGNSWGLHHPNGTDWRYQLNAKQHDPSLQRLVEVYSGHGNSEEYRTWRAFDVVDGENVCPAPTANFLPCCHQAGIIAREKNKACRDAPESAACEEAVANAVSEFMALGLKGQKAVPEADAGDWLDCGQCKDCFQPAAIFRPAFSVQSALAQTDLDNPAAPLRYTFGMIGSTDIHRARPGSGYKEGREHADIYGPSQKKFEVARHHIGEFMPDWERQNSYYYSGGLVAVHAASRSRDDIWDALMRKEVYATSGDRIKLWFYVEKDGDWAPMGTETLYSGAPRFRARAIGAWEQAPGCPEETAAKAGDAIDRLCLSECYNPTQNLLRIERIEVVRIRPQIRKDEPLEGLIEDPWLTLPCIKNSSACTVEFDDPEFADADRPAVYYVRAIQEPTLQLNGKGMQCVRDGEGNCLKSQLCSYGYKSDESDCLAPANERAWSSPIFLYPETAAAK